MSKEHKGMFLRKFTKSLLANIFFLLSVLCYDFMNK